MLLILSAFKGDENLLSRFLFCNFHPSNFITPTFQALGRGSTPDSAFSIDIDIDIEFITRLKSKIPQGMGESGDFKFAAVCTGCSTVKQCISMGVYQFSEILMPNPRNLR